MKKISVCIFLLMIILCCNPERVSADTGPKPSITVRITNPPKEKYYVDLLQQGEYDKHRKIEQNYDKSDEFYLKKFLAYHENDWHARIDEGICDDCLHPQNAKHRYEFGYIVPKYFRVILVTESGRIYTSKPIEKQMFQGEFVYDTKTGNVTEQNLPTKQDTLKGIVFTILVTYIIEGIVLFLCGLWNWYNLKRFLLVNLFTQFFLYVCLLSEAYSFFQFAGYIAIEIVIMLVESVIYCIQLRDANHERCRGRSFAYGIAANIASFATGIFLWRFMN